MNTHTHPSIHPSALRLSSLQLLQSVDLSVGLSFCICKSVRLSACLSVRAVRWPTRSPVCARPHSGRERLLAGPRTHEREGKSVMNRQSS
mmetsp:Transcript_20344/g.49470  ORF Transcript_20344/g.49470 Transcript_20344/m.49470 type:complete len:90 (-) Transcript_20344:191-460(-)